MFFIILLLLLQVLAVFANTEKTIFLGPASLRVPVEHPTLEDLHLEALSPQYWSLRTYVDAEFPTSSSKYGKSSWYLLHGLQEGQRYEVRICWAATQPTSFRLDTYDLATVFETPELIRSLAKYSEGKQSEFEDQKPSVPNYFTYKHTSDDATSTLFLHVHAAADYYTTNETLMENPPPVHVDIILDPFVFNVLPRSLVPTVAYIVLLAIGAWYLSAFVAAWFHQIGKHGMSKKKQ